MYQIVGKRSEKDFIVYPKSLSEYFFNNLFSSISVAQLAGYGITPTGYLTTRLAIQAIDETGSPQKYSLISYVPSSAEELVNKMDSSAVKLIKEEACLGK